MMKTWKKFVIDIKEDFVPMLKTLHDFSVSLLIIKREVYLFGQSFWKMGENLYQNTDTQKVR